MNPNNDVEVTEDSNASVVLPIEDHAFESLGSMPTCEFDVAAVANVNANSNKSRDLNTSSRFLYLSPSREPEKFADDTFKHAEAYEMSSYLELSLDGSVVSENENGLPHSDSSNLSFVTAHESVSGFDMEFNQYVEAFDAAGAATSRFSRCSQLFCDNTNDCTQNKTTSKSDMPRMQEKLDREDDEDLVLNTAEETSLDSGLGSVDSAYGNSGEDDHTSDLSSSPASPEEQEYRIKVGREKKTTEDEFSAGDESDVVDPIQHLRSNKREHTEHLEPEEPVRKKPKGQRRVNFHDVTVYYFQRKQSFVTVPSQGGSTLGMDIKHIHEQTMTLREHELEIKRKHKRQVREHLLEQKVEARIKQLKFLNPELDTSSLSSMAWSEVDPDIHDPDSDTDDSLLRGVDDYFYLQPISAKKRRKILRMCGVDRIDGEEKLINRLTRESRENCGCSCDGICLPDVCECAAAGIQCQVDRESFPCSCVAGGCRNENGRVEFDSDRVRSHFEAIMERLNRSVDENCTEDVNTHIVFGGETEKDSISSLDSELDLMSSDEAEQSESENTERYKEYGGKLDDIDLLENLVFANLEQSIADKAKTQPVFYSSDSGARTDTDIHVESVVSEANRDALSIEETIPQQFLDLLGLEKIECKISMNPAAGNDMPEPTLSLISQFNFAKNITSAPDTLLNSSGEYMPSMSFSSPSLMPDPIYTSSILPHYEAADYFDSLVSQGGVDDAEQTVTMAMTSQSMYGTSLPGRDSPAVLLDPIATFMTGSSGNMSDALSSSL